MKSVKTKFNNYQSMNYIKLTVANIYKLYKCILK